VRLWRGDTVAEQLADRDAVDTKAATATVVRLDEHTDDVVLHTAGRGPNAGFELMTDHAGAAADVPFRNVGRRRCERRAHMLRRDALRADVVEKPVKGLADDR
jgi:hypothetical protein